MDCAFFRKNKESHKKASDMLYEAETFLGSACILTIYGEVV